jgi:prepilin peptidase CpaA
MPSVLMLLPMLSLLTWAAVQDVRTRRIPNWLTFSMAGCGLLASVLWDGGIAPMQALAGLLVGFAVPFVLFLLGAVGAGDVKLLAGIGAWVGPWPILAVLVIEKLVGLAIVLVQCAWSGKLKELLRNSAVLAMNLAHVNRLGATHVSQLGQSFRSIDRPLPYAVPVLAATLIVTLLM